MSQPVDSERPCGSHPLDGTTDALGGLREILAAEEPLTAVLSQVASSAARAIRHVDAVTVTILSGTGPNTVAWTDDRYLNIDKSQYAAGRGPSLEAARSRRPLRASTGSDRQRWPEFAAAAELVGVRAYLCVPLRGEDDDQESEGQPLTGALTLYSQTAFAFEAFDEALTRLVIIAAAQAISNARRWQQSREQVRSLENALTSRAEIDQAKGILMATQRCTADQAFADLVERSQRRNVKVRQIARELIETHTAPSGS